MDHVEYFTRQVYGRPVHYPANQQARILLTLTGKKTFAYEHLWAMEAAGIPLVRTHDPGNEYSSVPFHPQPPGVANP